ncbi:hypothetical protein KQI86_00760 [Clostridium sp. MSJ-11]|uniref:Ground-like protein n=1 Tax=Clostridium mobile TaxID=2841512 RepID=A0ABS6ECR2_9CLOT|nr:hypothetical protein [Clostridium mobile]MBU5482833.1 hypothetical protein [Clostridium mobile]
MGHKRRHCCKHDCCHKKCDCCCNSCSSRKCCDGFGGGSFFGGCNNGILPLIALALIFNKC